MLNTHGTLEFSQILSALSEFALSESAKDKIMELKPFLSEQECKRHMRDTTEAKRIIETFGVPPIAIMEDLDRTLLLTEKGSMLIPEQLTAVATFIHSCKRMASFLKKAETLQVNVAYYGMSFADLEDLHSEIAFAIKNDKVDSAATNSLQDIRRKIENLQSSVKAKLEAVLRSKKAYLSDNNVVMRNNRYAVPVKKEHKNQVAGVVIDTSNTGGTVFIEPSSVGKIQADINDLQIEEDNEVRKILYTLTALVEDNLTALRTNMGYMETLDFIFAKGKYSYELNANEVEINTKRVIKIVEGRHPLLAKDECVPLDFELGEQYRGIVITGPNTGGKTVSLKTVGLLTLMAQCGLHVPAKAESVFSMFANILCDIGDGQSISESLSTFSAHIKNIVEILAEVSHESLVLLDELGSGTDPAEGMGIAVAILEELRKSNCLFLATTHYPEIKDYAKYTPSLINARMAFDRENLMPLYKLQIGEAGESCALSIAERLGLPKHLLERAKKEAYPDDVTVKRSERFTDAADTKDTPQKAKPSRLVKQVAPKTNDLKDLYSMGDTVMILADDTIGIVYKPINEKGDLVVQVKGEKCYINHTKVKLQTRASELYPPDYDFSIVFDSVSNRKARSKMKKGHDPDLIITYDEFTK